MLDDPKQIQDDQDRCDHEQCMDPAASAGKPRENTVAEETQQPKHKQNNYNRPQHGEAPFSI